MTVKAPKTATQVVTANRLTDGIVVFFTAQSGWSDGINDAAVATTAEQGQKLLDAAQADVLARKVVEPYLIDVRTGDGSIEPVRYRERIRALGPTIRPDLGKQAELKLKAVPLPAGTGATPDGAALSWAY